MARPVKCRQVCALPRFREFGPGSGGTGEVEMGVDEYEAIRLIDHLGQSQEEAAARMGVSRATVQGIYDAARKKLAAVLMEGKRLRVAGGFYRICPQSGQCQGKGHGCCRRYGK